MSERTKRQYTHIQAMDAEITQMRAEGKTQREIADYYGFKDKYVVKRYLKRQRKNSVALRPESLPVAENDRQKATYLQKRIKIKKLSD